MNNMISSENLIKPVPGELLNGMALCLCKLHGQSYWKIIEIFCGNFIVDDEREEEVEILGYVPLENPFFAQRKFEA